MASAQKLALMQAAAMMTQGIAVHFGPGNLPATLDGKLSAEVQAEDLNVWNVFTVFYDGLRRAADDTQVFIEPQGAGSGPLAGLDMPSLLAELPALLANPAMGAAIATVKGLLGGASAPAMPAVSGPVAAPGANLPK